MEVIPATAEHYQALYGEAVPRTLRAYSAIEDGRVIGMAGIYRDGDHDVAFVRFTEEFTRNKRALIKHAPTVMKLFGNRVFAVCDTSKPTASAFLEHFGFKRFRGEVYVWKA